MNSSLKKMVITALLVGGMSLEALAAEGNLYRYRDAEGVLVVDFSVPPEYAGKGYEVLSPSGRLLRKVEPQVEVSPEEVVSPMAAAARDREDSFILRSYSTVDDIHRARKRRLEQIDREIDILETNITTSISRRDEQLEKAANYQRNGRPVPDVVNKVIKELDTQLQQADELLERRRSEYRETESRYTWYAERLEQLKATSAESPKQSLDTAQTSPGSASD